MFEIQIRGEKRNSFSKVCSPKKMFIHYGLVRRKCSKISHVTALTNSNTGNGANEKNIRMKVEPQNEGQ